MKYVFVYGILRGKYKTVGKNYIINADMYDTGLGYPAIDKLGGTGKAVGDIIEVDDETMKLFDEIEGVPHLYKRKVVGKMSNGSKIYIYVYQHDTAGMRPILDFSRDFRGVCTECLTTIETGTDICYECFAEWQEDMDNWDRRQAE